MLIHVVMCFVRISFGKGVVDFFVIFDRYISLPVRNLAVNFRMGDQQGLNHPFNDGVIGA